MALASETKNMVQFTLIFSLDIRQCDMVLDNGFGFVIIIMRHKSESQVNKGYFFLQTHSCQIVTPIIIVQLPQTYLQRIWKL